MYETQYGMLQRPTHRNTSWDLAKFEVCAHKFADLSEHGYGVALLNDCKYGYSTEGNVMRLTLLRAPKNPDAHCDMGHHSFRYAVYPHAGAIGESGVVAAAYQFNVPLLSLPVPASVAARFKSSPSSPSQPFFKLVPASGPSGKSVANVVLDAVKQAEDDANSVVVRLYEAYGGRADVILHTVLPVKRAVLCNILEDAIDAQSEEIILDASREPNLWDAARGGARLRFLPFQIVSVKLSLGA